MKTDTISIRGKKYKIVFCPDCEVWYVKNSFQVHKKDRTCERHQKTKLIRRKASRIACGFVNKKFRGDPS